jgi:transcriptional regulator of acetoin/glycerol metabolism
MTRPKKPAPLPALDPEAVAAHTGLSRLAALVVIDPEQARELVRATAATATWHRPSLAAALGVSVVTLWRYLTRLGMHGPHGDGPPPKRGR